MVHWEMPFWRLIHFNRSSLTGATSRPFRSTHADASDRNAMPRIFTTPKVLHHLPVVPSAARRGRACVDD
jgi:hypothetical protein